MLKIDHDPGPLVEGIGAGFPELTGRQTLAGEFFDPSFQFLGDRATSFLP